MSTLLAAAAGDGDAAEHVSKEALELFGRKLTGLLPVGFTPRAPGRCGCWSPIRGCRPSTRCRSTSARRSNCPRTPRTRWSTGAWRATPSPWSSSGAR
ncbi:hypothetical protein ACFQ60_24800 [Streptomyces zhihengii]